jgi:NAD(P)-dependent dehydrogenase (short-subunit alcohol dehydrogenase family)
VQPDVKALVLGGTGVVGSAVLRELARRGLAAVFTYHRSEDKARALALELGHRAVRVDLADAAATVAMLEALDPVDVVIHCAGVGASPVLPELDLAAWQHAMAVNVQSAFLACRWVATRARRCDVVLVGGLDRAQSLPLPVAYAASQGALGAMVMAAAHELDGLDVRVNMVALGPLEEGISQGLIARRRKDYESFSALRRPGKPDEAAKVIAWLALENSFIEGKVLPVNGGI